MQGEDSPKYKGKIAGEQIHTLVYLFSSFICSRRLDPILNGFHTH